MSSKNNIEKVLSDLKFSEEESNVFYACIQVNKEEQKGQITNAEERMHQMIKELINNEVQ